MRRQKNLFQTNEQDKIQEKKVSNTKVSILPDKEQWL